MSERPNDPSPPSEPPFVVCLHCGGQCAVGTRVCPSCGNVHVNASEWPPPPLGTSRPPVPKSERLMTGKIWLDFTLGFCAGAGMYGLYRFVTLFVLLLHPLLYYAVRRTFPVFGRGVAAVWLALLAALLGALALCASGSLGHP